MYGSGKFLDHARGRNQLTYGPIPRQRTKRLLQALLAYANDEFVIHDQLRTKIKVNWQTDYQLVVETTVLALTALTSSDSYNGQLNSNQIKASLKLLEKFLNILVDNRSQPRGSNKWNFTIKFWFDRYNKVDNLEKFEREWERLRPPKSSQATDQIYEKIRLNTDMQGLSKDVAATSSELTSSFNSEKSENQQQDFSKKAYLKRYSERHGILKVLGMREPAQLDSLYTKVHLLNEDSVLGFDSIDWLEKNYRQRKVLLFEGKSLERQSGLETANSYQYLMILGGPGAGKSTFLRKIGLEAFKNGCSGDYEHNCIPVFIELKKLSFIEIDFKSAIIQEFEICGFPKPQKFLEKALNQGYLLVLFDGLDEVSQERMSEVISKIQDFANRFHRNRFIISCRAAAYRYNLRNFTDVVIAEFDDTQIKQFIEKWFAKQPQQGFTCWKQLNRDSNVAAKELTRTPLLLTMLCLVFQREGQFPKHRVTLYEKSLWILLEEWDAEKEVPRESIYKGLATKYKEIVLSKVAFDAFLEDESFLTKRAVSQQLEKLLGDMLPNVSLIDGKKVLKSIELQHGLLVERVEGIYSFSHLSIQEYLAAQYIINQTEQDNLLIQELVSQHLIDDRWKEIFLLLSGMRKADQLLLFMESRAQSYIEKSPALKNVLRYADLMTQGTKGQFKSATKRAAAIGLIFPRVHPLSIITRFSKSDDLILKKALFLTYDLARELTGALTENRLLTSALDRIRTTDSVMYCGIEGTHKNGFIRAINISMISAKKFEKVNIFNNVDFTKLLGKLEALKNDIPIASESFEKNKIFAQCYRKTWLDAFKFDPKLVDFSLVDIDLFNNYLKALIVILYCKRAALSYSQSIWTDIESRLLTID